MMGGDEGAPSRDEPGTRNADQGRVTPDGAADGATEGVATERAFFSRSRRKRRWALRLPALPKPSGALPRPSEWLAAHREGSGLLDRAAGKAKAAAGGLALRARALRPSRATPPPETAPESAPRPRSAARRTGRNRRRTPPRSMTLRGKLTIAAGVALLLAPAIVWLASSGTGSDDPGLRPPVSAAPAEAEFDQGEAAEGASTAEAGSDPELAGVDAGDETGAADAALKKAAASLTIRPPAWPAPPVARGALAKAGPGALTLDPDLTARVWKVLDKGRVALGHVLVMDPRSGDLLAYVSTDPQRFPPDRAYPAASLVKVVTAAALMDLAPRAAATPCRYAGNKYRLNLKGVDPPSRGGNEATLRRALATSNNKCFAQYAVHKIGGSRLIDAIDRFGLLRAAAPAHPPGVVSDPGDDRLELGQLGSGLDGLRITPLHAIQLAGILAHGRRVSPTWVSDASPTGEAERVLTEDLSRELRDMLVETTRRGTARKAFRTRRGRPLLQGIQVAGKTGSLNGRNPDGRYEWFIGVAPAENPTLAVATVAVQGPLYWMSASQMAAEVLKAAFCPKGVCRPELVLNRPTRTKDQPLGG